MRNNTLYQTLIENESVKNSVIVQIAALIRRQAQEATGAEGFAIQGGLALIEGLHKEALELALKVLLPDFVQALEPLYQAFRTAEKKTSLSDYFFENRVKVAEALLLVTDQHAQESGHFLLRKTYATLRPFATRQVEPVTKEIGAIIETYIVVTPTGIEPVSAT